MGFSRDLPILLRFLGVHGQCKQNNNQNDLFVVYLQESSVSEAKSTASGVKYATLGGHTDAQRKKDAKKLEKEAR